MLINQQYWRGRLIQRHCHKSGGICNKCHIKKCDTCRHHQEIPALGWESIPRLTDEQIKTKNWASL